MALGLLKALGQWDMRVDIGRKLVFPQNIVMTGLRLDIVLLAERSTPVVMVELTVPWEQRVKEAYHLKETKHDKLTRSACPKERSDGYFQWKWGAGASQDRVCGARSAN